jgi:rod shape-determining protein MreD
MRTFWLYVLFLLGIMLQTTLLPVVSLWHVKADLSLLLLFISCFVLSGEGVIVFAVFGGVCRDIFLSQSFGMNTVLFPLAAAVVLRVRKEIELGSPVLCLLFLFVFVCAFELVSAFVSVWPRPGIHVFTICKIIILEAAYTSALFFVLHKPLKFLLRLPDLG